MTEPLLPVAVRAYTMRTEADDDPAEAPSHWPLSPEQRRPTYFVAFDTETTTDASQRLLFGAWLYCRLDWHGDTPSMVPLDEGLFYEDDLNAWDPSGYGVLRGYVEEHLASTERTEAGASTQLRLQSRETFCERVLWRAGYERQVHVALFNAGFDLSRIATRAGVARATQDKAHPERPPDRRFAGGFSLFPGDPRTHRIWFKVKHIDSKRALKRFAGPKNIDPEDLEWVEHEDDPRAFRGHIVDCRTLAFALTNVGHSLESACEAFDVPYRKRSVSHGEITPEYVDYCREDVRATAELFTAEMSEYVRHPIELQATRAYSPASIAKAYLREMGVSPPGSRLGSVPDGETWDRVMGYAMTSYYGGRTECRIRRTPAPVAVLDFTSQYPSACRLLEVWKLLTAARIDAVEDDPAAVKRFVERLSTDHLFEPRLWRRLFAICQVEPEGEILPVRARYEPSAKDEEFDPQTTHPWGIGVNPFTSSSERTGWPAPWYALPDIVAAKVLSGRSPTIRRVIRFRPAGGTLSGLRATSLRGQVGIDPRRDDLFKVTIEERVRRASDLDLSKAERERLGDFLKVVANSAAYGIFAEINRTELGSREKENVRVFGLESFPDTVSAPESPGHFFFAPIASIVTAAGRLLLSMLEHETASKGGAYVAADTDSMFVVATKDARRPRGLDPSVPVLAWSDVREIQARFIELNPYDRLVVDEVLKSERGSLDRELWCYGVSAKRYVLYRKGRSGRVVLGHGEEEEDTDEDAPDFVKPSEHGLGHLLNPIIPDSSSRDWITEAWRYLMALDQGEDPPEPLWLDRPAVSQISISTPAYWQLFDRWNEGRTYAEGIKPFGFMLVALVDPLKSGEQVGRLIHPYERNPDKWLRTEWADLYEPGKPYRIGVRRPGDVLSRRGVVFVRTYRDVLLSYLGHPEAKSLGPDGEVCRRHTRGILARRPVEAVTVSHIGKEGNRLEERLSGLVSEGEALLKLGGDRSWEMLFRPTLATFSTEEIRKVCRMASNTVKDIVSGRTRPQARHERILRPAAVELAAERLPMWNQEAPSEPTALLAVYLQEAARRDDEIASNYEAALERLRKLKSKHRGIVERVARCAGVSRRRLWSLRDPDSRQAVIAAIEEETGGV